MMLTLYIMMWSLEAETSIFNRDDNMMYILILKIINSLEEIEEKELKINENINTAVYASTLFNVHKNIRPSKEKTSLASPPPSFFEDSSNFFLKQTSKENLAEVGFELMTSGLQVQCSTIWAIQPYNGVDPFLTNIFALGASQKPYNLACRVRGLHPIFIDTTLKAIG